MMPGILKASRFSILDNEVETNVVLRTTVSSTEKNSIQEIVHNMTHCVTWTNTSSQRENLCVQSNSSQPVGSP